MAVSFTTYSLIASLVVLALFLLYRALSPKPIPGIPYNKAATQNLFGDVPAFLKWNAKREVPEFYAWITEQCIALDSPIIQVFMRPFSKPWVVLTDFREAQDIMVHRTSEFDRSAFFSDILAGIAPHNQVVMPTGPEWRAHRRLMGDLMAPKFVNEVVGRQLYSTASDLIELWREKIRLAEGRSFAAGEDVNHGALDMIWAAAFGGAGIGTTKSQIDALRQLDRVDLPRGIDDPVEIPVASTPTAFNSIITLTESCEIAMNSPVPRLHHKLALRLYPRLRSAMKVKNRMVKEALDTSWRKFAQQSEKEENVDAAVDLIVQREITMAKKENRPAQHDTAAIQDELFGFLVGGHDTTSTTICWGLKHITGAQDKQDKLRSTLQTYYQRAFEAGDNPTVEEIVKADIPYLDGVIEEFHRLGGTASANNRRAKCDTQVLGYHVPKGTDVFFLSNGPGYKAAPLAVDENTRSKSSMDTKDRWGEWEVDDIAAFKPERWLVQKANGEMEFNPLAGPAMPFGAGPRSCYGRRLASLELKIVFTLLIWNFVLKPTPENLSSFVGHDKMTHNPHQCYLRLEEVKR